MIPKIENVLFKQNKPRNELIKWRQKLIFFLESKHSEKVDLFLINKEWLDKYAKSIIFNFKEEKELLELSSKFEKYDNCKLDGEINENSNFYILNKICWDSIFQNKKEANKKFEGYFLNKILLIIIGKICFFLYLDNNKEIKKGLFHINNYLSKNQEYIINYFEKNNPIINCDQQDSFLIKNGIKFKILEDNSIFNVNENENEKLGQYLPKLSEGKLPFNKTKTSIKKIYSGKLKGKYKRVNEKYDKNKENNLIKALKSNNFIKNEEKVEIINTKYNTNITLIKRVNKNKIPKNYRRKKYKDENKNIYNFNQQNSIKQKGKENININLDIKRNKELFNPQTKIVKRMPSVKQKIVPKFGFIKKNEDKEHLFRQFLPKQAVHRESIPGVIGLSNIGSIPYMNAIIQCFSNAPFLRNELLKKDIYENLEKNRLSDKKLSFALAEIFYNLWKDLKHRIYEPNNFEKIINEINSYNPKIFIEPKDLIIFLLDQMNKELNNVSSELNNVSSELKNISSELNKNEIKQNESQNNNNFINIFNNAKKDFENKNNSIITKEFIGYYENIQRCLKCNMISQNIQNFKILSFSLDEIRKFNNYNINYVNIYDCFEWYQKKQNIQLNGHNCGGNIININQFLFMPKTLIINFEYRKDTQNYANVIYEEYLNLKKYLMIINDSPYYYELVGVICYLNSNEKGNYYVAYCKNSKDLQWYKYNDKEVTKSSFREINGQPFILFFSYIQA